MNPIKNVFKKPRKSAEALDMQTQSINEGIDAYKWARFRLGYMMNIEEMPWDVGIDDRW